MTAVAIRYAHAGDLSTNDAHELEWAEGCIGSRYQEIAIVGERVIGSWIYDVEWHRGHARIDSSSTGVLPRFRRKGVAQMLWLRGIARWQPTRIESTIGTDDGRAFLARMTAELAYRAPGTFLSVQRRPEDESSWADRVQWAAIELLNVIGRASLAQKSVAPAAPLKLIKGAT